MQMSTRRLCPPARFDSRNTTQPTRAPHTRAYSAFTVSEVHATAQFARARRCCGAPPPRLADSLSSPPEQAMPPPYSDSGSEPYHPSDGTSSASTESPTQSLRVPRPDLVDYLSDDDFPPSADKLPSPSDIVYSRQIPQGRLVKSRLIKVLRREPAIGEEATTGEGLVPTEAEDEPEGGEEYQDGGEAVERSSSSAAATVAAEAQVAAEEGDGATGEWVVGASVEGEAESAGEGTEPAEGSEQAEEEEEDEEEEQPSFGPAVQAVHSITSIDELDRQFEALRRRSTWFSWDAKVRKSKTKRQPCALLSSSSRLHCADEQVQSSLSATQR